MGWGDCLSPKRNKFRQKANNVAQIRRKRYNFQEMEKTKKYFKKTRDRWRTFVLFPNAGETMIKRTERSRELRKQPSFAATLEIQRERKKESLANSPRFIERTAAGNLLPPPSHFTHPHRSAATAGKTAPYRTITRPSLVPHSSKMRCFLMYYSEFESLELAVFNLMNRDCGSGSEMGKQ